MQKKMYEHSFHSNFRAGFAIAHLNAYVTNAVLNDAYVYLVYA